MRVLFPDGRAFKLAQDVRNLVLKCDRELLESDLPRDPATLERFCKQRDIHVVRRPLPTGKKAVALNVEGTKFIVLDKSAESNDDLAFIIAHELSHVVLGHLEQPSFAAAGYSETLSADGIWLQRSYHTEQEVVANLLSMMIVLPDPYLDDIVEKKIWIPAETTRKKTKLSLNLVSARIKLYRQLYGYDRSEALWKARRPEDRMSQGGYDKRLNLEMTDSTSFQGYLPLIDERMVELFMVCNYKAPR